MQAPNFFGMKIPDDVGIEEQECIPVGCVQSVAVVVSWGGGGGICLGVSARQPPLPREQNDRQV